MRTCTKNGAELFHRNPAFENHQRAINAATVAHTNEQTAFCVGDGVTRVDQDRGAPIRQARRYRCVPHPALGIHECPASRMCRRVVRLQLIRSIFDARFSLAGLPTLATEAKRVFDPAFFERRELQVSNLQRAERDIGEVRMAHDDHVHAVPPSICSIVARRADIWPRSSGSMLFLTVPRYLP